MQMDDRDLLCLSGAARDAPSAIALHLQDRSVTYEQLFHRASSHLERLRSLRGVLALVARPDIETISVFCAALQLDCSVFLIHPGWDETTKTELLAQVRPALHWDGERWGSCPPPHRIPHRARPLGSVLVATSGSGGSPKIVCLSRENLISAAQASAQVLGWAPCDRWLLSLPFAHVGGLSVLTRCLVHRKTVVVAELRPRDPGFLGSLESLGVTLISFVPTQLHSLENHRPPSSLRAVLVGGGPASPSLLAKLRGNGWPLRTTYGMTEMSSQVATQTDDTASASAVGRPLPGVEVKISRDERILVKGPSLMLGYLDSDATMDEQGFLVTNDRGRWTSRGELVVLGRWDHTIISGGENISPEDIEQRLAGVPGVSELAVVGVPDPQWGQKVVLLFVPEEAAAPDQVALDELVTVLRSRARRQLPRYSVPKSFKPCAALPKTHMGKLKRSELAALAEE